MLKKHWPATGGILIFLTSRFTRVTNDTRSKTHTFLTPKGQTTSGLFIERLINFSLMDGDVGIKKKIGINVFVEKDKRVARLGRLIEKFNGFFENSNKETLA